MPVRTEINQDQLDRERDLFFARSLNKLELLSDYSLALFTLLLYRSGYGRPTEPVITAQISLRQQLGSSRSGKEASKKVIREAARELEEARLLQRERTENQAKQTDGLGTPYAWKLKLPENASNHTGLWQDTPRFAAMVVRGEKGINPVLRAGAIRLAADANEDGIWTGSWSDLAETFRVASIQTAEKRLLQIRLADCGIESLEQSAQQVSIELTKPRSVLSEAEFEDLADRLVGQVWHLEEVKELAKQLAQSRGGNLGYRDQVESILNPLVELQKDFSNPHLLRYGLEETLKSKSTQSPNLKNWAAYCRTVMSNHENRFLYSKIEESDETALF